MLRRAKNKKSGGAILSKPISPVDDYPNPDKPKP